MKKILSGILIIAMIAGTAGCERQRRSIPTTVSPEGVVCDFENVKVWDISPETGFTLSLSKEYVKEDRHSLKVVFPAAELPSINTKKLPHKWGKYDALCIDIYNPQDRRLEFTVRLDDDLKKRTNIEQVLMPGWNTVRIDRAQIEGAISPEYVSRVVLFLNGPDERVALYFDNMRLEGYRGESAVDQRPETVDRRPENGEWRTAGSERRTADGERGTADSERRTADSEQRTENGEKEKKSWGEEDKPITIPKSTVQYKGEMRVPVTKLTDEKKEMVLVSSGIPFPIGVLYSDKDIAFYDDSGKEIPVSTKILAKWPQDESIRSVLVRFNIPIRIKYAYVTIKWGTPRTIPDTGLADGAWSEPEGMVVLPSQWLCASHVIGDQVPITLERTTGMPVTQYDLNIVNNINAMSNPLTGDMANDDFYDTTHVFYQLYARTGSDEYFKAAHKEALRYRDTHVIMDGPNRGCAVKRTETRYIYMEGMTDDYLLTGDPKSLLVAGYMAEYLKKAYPPSKAFYSKNSQGFWTERDAAFPLLDLITYYELTGDMEYFDTAKQIMQNLYKTQNEWPGRGGFIHNLYAHDTEEGARRDEYGGSPFMTGLLLEAVVKYHQLTNSEMAKDSIFMALDWLMKEAVSTDGDSFIYLTCDARRGEGHPDLNMLIAHAFGYGYKISGYTRDDYLELGKKVFNRGVKSAFLGNRKHFNQNYRSSGHFLAYINRPETVDQRPEAGEKSADDVSRQASDVRRQ